MRSHLIVLPALLSVALLAGCASHLKSTTAKPRSESSPRRSHSATPSAPHSIRSLADALLSQAKQNKSFKKALLSGILALKANDNVLVGKAAKYAQTLNPSDPEPYILLAKNALIQAQIPAAEKYANQAYKDGGIQAISLIFKGPVDPWINLALSSRLMKAHPENHYLGLFTARYALDVGQYRRALLVGRKVSSYGETVAPLAHFVWAEAMWGLGRHRAALELMRKQYEHDRSNHFITGIYAGFLARTGKKKKAGELLAAMAPNGQPDEQTELARASVDVSVGDFSGAQNALTMLLQKGNDSPGVYNLLGEIASAKHHWGEAFGWYHRVIHGAMVGSSQVAAVYALSHWRGVKAAEAYVGNLNAVLPGYAPTWSGVGATLAMKEHKTLKAFRILQEARRKYPMDLALRYQLGVLAARTHRSALAMRTLRGLLRICPRSPIYMNAYGYTLAEYTHRYRRSESLIKKALSMDPNNGAYLDSMGWVLYRQGHYRKALPFLKKAWHRSEDATVAYHLVEDFLALGEKPAAQRVLRRALHHHLHAKDLLKLRDRLRP